MNSKTLIITSGSSQLITQLSVLKKKRIDICDVYLIYTGLYSDSLDVFFNQMSKKYGFEYVGQIQFDVYPIPLSKKEFIYYFFTNKFNRLFNQVENKFPLLKNYRNFNLLLIPVRVKVFEDTVLLSYLKPKNIIFTADGVIDILPKRDLKGWQYIYLKHTITRFPLLDKIYSPYFLSKDIATIGSFEDINIEVVLSEVSKLELAKRFEKFYLNDSISYVIISQHYHLHEGIELDKDISYYKQIIEFALQNCDDSKILFKPHPRDIKEKIENLQLIADNRLIVVDDDFKSLPIELFGKQLKEKQVIFLTGNSSAPLYYNNSNKIISVCSQLNLHVALNNRIKEFTMNYNVEYMNL